MRKLIGSEVTWGVLTILIAGIMLLAGIREVWAYWGVEALPVTVGLLGAFAGGVLLISGFALAIRMAFSRAVAVLGALSMIAVHLTGWILGIVGYGGALPGVGYPLLLLVVLKAKPNLGAPSRVNEGHEPPKAKPSRKELHKKTALHAALPSGGN
jgi:hypothetical protein